MDAATSALAVDGANAATATSKRVNGPNKNPLLRLDRIVTN
jgi:hypothetical protein